jgi:hypothetical protein
MLTPFSIPHFIPSVLRAPWRQQTRRVRSAEGVESDVE